MFYNMDKLLETLYTVKQDRYETEVSCDFCLYETLKAVKFHRMVVLGLERRKER